MESTHLCIVIQLNIHPPLFPHHTGAKWEWMIYKSEASSQSYSYPPHFSRVNLISFTCENLSIGTFCLCILVLFRKFVTLLWWLKDILLNKHVDQYFSFSLLYFVAFQCLICVSFKEETDRKNICDKKKMYKLLNYWVARIRIWNYQVRIGSFFTPFIIDNQSVFVNS